MAFTSSNLQQKLELLTPTQLTEIKRGFQWISNHLSNCMVLGGVAVVSYVNGERFLTPDLDIMVSDISLVQQKLDAQNLKYTHLTNDLGITVNEFNLDILNAKTDNIALNKLTLKTPNQHLIYDENYNIIQPELLTILKLELGREKDLEDGFMLLQSGSLNRSLYMDYLEQLKDHLSEYQSLKSYAILIS